nr:dihydropteroate synthase [Gorillibacterium massiliense]
MKNAAGNSLQFGEFRLDISARTQIMGILNVTPDSFSDGGRFLQVEAAVERAFAMAAEGADIIDVGGESTRPGHAQVEAEEELARILPVIEALSRAGLSKPISVDTYKAEVARLALSAGAHIINDIWGGKKDPDMLNVAAEYGCPIILMHNRMDMNYGDFLEDVVRDLLESVELARQAGVREEQIILDPGIGFAKTHEMNLAMMANLDRITGLGYPVLLAASRKSTLRWVLDLPADDIVEGTLATTVMGIMQGAGIVRVHDITANKRAAQMADAVKRYRSGN